MNSFKNILYVSLGDENNDHALTQALSLARNNQAEIETLIIAPEFPGPMSEHIVKFESYATENMEQRIRTAGESLGADGAASDVKVTIRHQSGGKIASDVIAHALKNGHDLIIKEADCHSATHCRGFKALDMDLLRKSACPVWLTHPITRPRQDIRVAVAIDPEGEQPAAGRLAQRLLKMARQLADTCGGKLDIVSCWRYEFESHVSNNIWFKLPQDEVSVLVEKERLRHRQALDNLISESGIAGQTEVHHLKGRAEDEIPEFIRSQNIDILVMGTVARTGIPGFLIGNTAENIIQQIECSLLAVKPHEFVSPVKPE